MDDMAHSEAVLSMMNRLYDEDHAPDSTVDPGRFPQTLHTLLAHPQMGRIVLLYVKGVVQGYALLIPYWSNEYGGFLLFVDELYVMADARGRGLGKGFFNWLTQSRPFDAVAIFLEVSPANHRARRFYEQLGFVDREHRTMVMRLN